MQHGNHTGLHTLHGLVEAIVDQHGDRWFGFGTYDTHDPLAARRMEADRALFEAAGEMLCALRVVREWIEATIPYTADRTLREIHGYVLDALRRADGLPALPVAEFDWDDDVDLADLADLPALALSLPAPVPTPKATTRDLMRERKLKTRLRRRER